jgi:hypothetical protein
MTDMTTLRKVRTGKTSYLKLNEADYKAWLKAGNKEYGDELSLTEEVPDEAPEAPTDAKAKDAPAETKQVAGPAENKAAKAPAAKKSED